MRQLLRRIMTAVADGTMPTGPVRQKGRRWDRLCPNCLMRQTVGTKKTMGQHSGATTVPHGTVMHGINGCGNGITHQSSMNPTSPTPRVPAARTTAVAGQRTTAAAVAGHRWSNLRFHLRVGNIGPCEKSHSLCLNRCRWFTISRAVQ
jgi:hypothetical protein